MISWAYAFVLLSTILHALHGEGKIVLREVWMRHQDIYVAPYSFSRRIARVAQGSLLEVLEEREPWSRVRLARVAPETAVLEKARKTAPAESREGWTVWRAPPSASRPDTLSPSPAASPASIALAVKAFEQVSEAVAELLPEAERAFSETANSWLEPELVREFARSAGLRLPEEGGSR